jgi:methionyl-tRNA synthetase
VEEIFLSGKVLGQNLENHVKMNIRKSKTMKNSEKFYITTPIYYVNALPHIGHAYTTIVADVFRRFHAQQGEETFFLTGTDEHGGKIVEKAAGENVTPRVFADKISQKFRNLWPSLNIENDYFIRTTDEFHQKEVQKALQQLYDRDLIYQADYSGDYCLGCERYLDREDLDAEGLCRDHLKKPRKISETNYFFKMSLYQEKLKQHISDNKDFIFPENYRNEVLAFLKEPLRDLCLSRPKSRLNWGIELPFDENYVTYVWVDALLSYISGLGGRGSEKFEKFWPVSHHLLAKDIVKTHCIYWSCILMGLGIDLPKKFIVHGYWNSDQAKMSKSLGNVVSPLALKEAFGSDALRYYLVSAMSFGLDANFSYGHFVEKYNADLANTLGNLLSRSITLLVKHFDGFIGKERKEEEGFETLAENLKKNILERQLESEKLFREFRLNQAVMEIVKIARLTNQFIDELEPWKLAKNGKKELLSQVLLRQCRSLRLLAFSLYPVMPEISKKLMRNLGYTNFPQKKENFVWEEAFPQKQLEKVTALFPRVSLEQEEKNK